MKIAFIASTFATQPYQEYYAAIIHHLTKQNHTVSHQLNTPQTSETLTNFYKDIKHCDLAIAECSFPSISIGYEISYAINHGKEVIILKATDADISILTSGILQTDKNAYVYEYDKNNLPAILQEALQFRAPQKYKKFNVLFTPDMVTKLNLISKRKNLPKSVYIRQLIEKSLALEKID